MQLTPHPVVAEPFARQARPAESVFAFLDVLLGGAALVGEAHHPVRLHGQVGNDEAHAGEQLARMPLDLGDDAALFFPALGQLMETHVEALDLGLRGAAHRLGQPMRDLLAQHGIGWPGPSRRNSLPLPAARRSLSWHRRHRLGRSATDHARQSARSPGQGSPVSRRRCGRYYPAERTVPAFQTG